MTCRLIRGLGWVAILGALLGSPADGLGGARSTRLKGRSHWAFQPVKRPAVPDVRNSAWVRTPVDAFVLAELELRGIKPAPAADRRTLLRRVYLDLIGLPPTPAEQRAFLGDRSPEAYAKVVDDLLSRPQYGERWARHWLDVARYAESNGYERDGAKPSAWRYRDYVINAFNQDKPYDRFVTEQLAGDEMPGTNAEAQIATTFLRLGTWDDEPADPLVDRYDQLDDVLGTTAAAFLGVTLRCARCHDHKFEPFSQVDYYRMLAVFEPLKRPQKDREDLDWPVGDEWKVAAYQAAVRKVEAEKAELRRQIDGLKTAIRERLFGERRPLTHAAVARSGARAITADRATTTGRPLTPTLSPEGRGSSRSPAARRTSLPPEAVAAFRTKPGQRTSQQQTLVERFRATLEKEIRAAATPEEKARRERREKQLAAVATPRVTDLPHAYIWYEENPKAPVTHVLRRGDPNKPKRQVGPGVPVVLTRQQPEPPRPTAHSTGRRLWLAGWMTRPDNPLVARVMVNRLWQHHFGRGLVGTPNDFGVVSEPPSHPALLDWLAREFMANGWHLKPLHRLMVLSSSYQMAATAEPKGALADPRGQLLSHWQERRLEAEAVRDAVLAVSGRLNPQMAGPSIYPPIPRAVLQGQSRPGEGWGKSDERQAARRSVYIFVKRVLAVPELELLDAPDTTSSCEQRPVSTTAPQALTFLNGDFINRQARHFAARLRREAGNDARAQVERAFELALCRPPRAEELKAATDFLAAQQRQIEVDARAAKKPVAARQRALEAFCLVILNTNEFVYVN